MQNGLPFLQIFPEMVQQRDVTETFKRKEKERNKKFNTS